MAPAAGEVISISSSPVVAEETSSPLSYASARSSRARPTSSNVDSPPITYRSVKPLPWELQEHCSIYLEEGLYTQALNLLISLVVAGTASTIETPALVPPPQFLRLISTLTVHPTLTTRAKSADRIQAANLAHHYLRLVLKLVGPKQINAAETFKFDGLAGRHGFKRRTTRTGPAEEHISSIENDLANSAAVFAQAESFSHVVGWVFNCSILYPKRWERWSLWLEYMTDVLEIDWALRVQADEMEESLIVQYIILGGGQTDSGKKLLRAIFADGKKVSVGEWKEVWQSEAKDLKVHDDVKRSEKPIKIEEDDYGDYVSEEEDEDLVEDTSSPIEQQETQALSTDTSASADTFGGTSALNLRVRLLSLLSQVANKHPRSFSWSTQKTINGTERLYNLILEHVRPLALPDFSLFTSPSTLRPWNPHATCVFIQYLLHRGALIDGAAPEPESYLLTEATLLESHLPWAASGTSIADNAKVSICIEYLMRLFDRHGPGLIWTQQLEECTELGIKRREDKAKVSSASKRGRKRKRQLPVADEIEDWAFLRESAARIRMLLLFVKDGSVASQGSQ